MEVDQLNSLEKIPLQHAQVMAISMLDPKTKALRLNRLKHDIHKAKTSREVMRIMWNAYLSGTGYGVPTSAWQKQYRGA